MGKVTSVVIDEQLDVFIGEQVNQGRFKTADAVVEAGCDCCRNVKRR